MKGKRIEVWNGWIEVRMWMERNEGVKLCIGCIE